MNYGKIGEKLMTMSDTSWKRHANPLSVWTRIPILPLFTIAIWSREWIGIWSLLPIAVIVFWTWWNPRAFPIPTSTNNWASKGTSGERVWLNQKNTPIPQHHNTAANILSVVSLLGMLFWIWGIVYLEIWPTLLGITISMGGKIWFVDRMVWLYKDMKDKDPEYASWLY